jgi:hypothetical protein
MSAVRSAAARLDAVARLAYNAQHVDWEQIYFMTNSPLTPGAAAPSFTLTALGSGRHVGPAGSSDALLLVFHDQNTVDAVQSMQEGLRSRYTDASQLQIASVVNMKSVPVFLRGAAEAVMKNSYAKAAAAMPQGLDAADYVVILIDWDGTVSKAYGAHQIARRPRLVLLDRGGTVSAIHQDAEIGDAALAMVERLLGTPTSSTRLATHDDPA